MANPTISVAINATTGGLTHALSGVQSTLQGLTGSLSSFATTTAAAFNPLVTALNPVAGIAKTAADAIMGIAGAAFDFGSKALKASADMETLKAGLEFNLGKQLGGDMKAAAEKTNLLISEMQLLGEASAYDSNQLIPLARSWVNIGDSAETAVYKMQTITDAASAYGLTTEAMERVNLALTQMQMKGKMQAEEMMQLTEAGIPAWTLLSQAMGLPTDQLQDMASKGQLTQEAMAALFNSMKEQTGGMANTLSNTLSGKFANIREAAENSLGSIGDIISKGLNVPGILDQAGELVEGVKNHIDNIKENAESVGVGQAIVDELNSVVPGIGDFVAHVISGLGNIWETIKAALVPALEHLGEAFGEAGDYGGSIFESLCAAVEELIVIVAAIIEVLALVVKALGALYDFFMETFKALGEAINSLCNWITETFGESFSWIGEAWHKLCEALSNPIDLIVNVIWHDTKDGTTTAGNKITKQSKLPGLEKFTAPMMGGGAPSATGGKGGGRAKGSGGRSSGGHKKDEPWAGRKDYIGDVETETSKIVQTMLDKAEAKAQLSKKAVDPVLEVFSDNNLGNTFKNVYETASKEASKAGKIISNIGKIGKNNDLAAYGKVWEKSKEKIKNVGEQMQKFREYQKKVNEEADKYAGGGEKTQQYLEKRTSLLKEIGDLEEKIVKGKGNEDTQAKLDRKLESLASLDFQYTQSKNKAAAEKKSVNAAAPQVERASKEKIAEIEQQTMEKLYARETQLEAANDQLKKANMKTELADYIAMMEAKDAYTGQSYAAILAQEEALNAQRQVWHEQLMLNAMEWADFMSMTFANLNQQLVDGLSSGLAECIVQGKTLGEIFSNLATNLLQTLINNVLKKWLTSLIGIGAQEKANTAAEIARSQTMAAAKKPELIIAKQLAVANVIAANPLMSEVAPVIVNSAVAAVGFAVGGLVSGAGTSTSDSIPAMLSNGEFVMRAEAVERLGTPFLYALNSGESFHYHYSGGGQVGSGSGGSEMGSSPGVTVNVSALDAASFETFLLHGGLDTIRQAMYDNNRNFGAAAGVF